MSAIAIGSFPPDSASSVRARRRRYVREPKRREDRGGIRRRDDGAEQERLEPGEIEQRVGHDARDASALTTTPTVLRSAAGTATDRSRRQEVCRPPS